MNPLIRNSKRLPATLRNLPKYVVAFVLAALTPALIIVVISLIEDMFEHSAILWSQATGIGLIVFVVAGIHVVVFGIPAFLLCRLAGIIHWWTPPAAGFAIGVIPLAALGNAWFIPGALFLGLLGASGGFTFWLVYRTLEPAVAGTETAKRGCRLKLGCG